MALKYDALADYLQRQNGPEHTMRFAEIEGVIRDKVPASSRTHKAWWGNDRYHSQSKDGWLAAGWEVDPKSLDLNRQTVTFRK